MKVCHSRQLSVWVAVMLFAGMMNLADVVAASAADGAQLISLEPRTNFFGGREERLRFTVAAAEPVIGRVDWLFAAGERTIARGEIELKVAADRSTEFALPLRCPPVREGVVFRTKLIVTVVGEGMESPLATLEQPIWLFPDDALADRQHWLNELDIALYDPVGATDALFREISIPHKWLPHLSALEQLRHGLLVIGEGVSPDDKLAPLVLEKAAAGVAVLWLSPGDGDLPLAQSQIKAARIDWRRSDVIAALDKRLDSAFWSPDGIVAQRSLTLVANGDAVVARVSDEQAAWPWLEIKYSSPRASLIVCGFRIVDAWPHSPTPRFLLVRMLEELQSKVMSEKSTK